jgi:hypothetical protein
MHLVIVLLLGLFHFSAIMIVFNLAIYIIPYHNVFYANKAPANPEFTPVTP